MVIMVIYETQFVNKVCLMKKAVKRIKFQMSQFERF